MDGETDTRCSLCGFRAETALRAVFEWEWYLMAERNVDLGIEGVRIPLCTSCVPRAAALQEAFLDLDRYTEAEQDAIYEDAHDLLDELDLAALLGVEGVPEERDEARPSP